MVSSSSLFSLSCGMKEKPLPMCWQVFLEPRQSQCLHLEYNCSCRLLFDTWVSSKSFWSVRILFLYSHDSFLRTHVFDVLALSHPVYFLRCTLHGTICVFPLLLSWFCSQATQQQLTFIEGWMFVKSSSWIFPIKFSY